MRHTIIAILLFAAQASASEWVLTEGGSSPNKKFGVAVYPQKTEFVDEANGAVLLIDLPAKRVIGPLTEVDSTGGGWGTTTTNVNCSWSADSSLLFVSCRYGRLMHGTQVYRIAKRRAFPLELPPASSHPKGAIFKVLESTANPGSEVVLNKDGSLTKRMWGFLPAKGHWNEDYSRFGIRGFGNPGNELFLHYTFKKDGTVRLTDITAE